MEYMFPAACMAVEKELSLNVVVIPRKSNLSRVWMRLRIVNPQKRYLNVV